MVNLLLALLIALIFVLAAPGCSTTAPKAGPQPDGTVVVVIPAGKVKACAAEGGCGVYSTARLVEMQQEAFEAGADVACNKNRMPL